jgi:hypothetical protein
MQTRLLLLLLSLVLLIPSASGAGFLGPARNSNDGIPEVEFPDPLAAPGIPNIAGRARSTFASNFVIQPPPGPTNPETTVPEPEAGLLTAIGLLGLAVRRRGAAA